MGSPRLAEPLAAIESALARELRPGFVFDLDSTLLHTGARHLAILRSFAAATGERTGRAWQRLRELVLLLEPGDFGYEVTDPLRAEGLRDHAMEEALLAFWAERYFTTRACTVDQPAPGAVSYVQAAFEAGAHIWYLTGRPHEAMLAGTTSTLRRLGFPMHSQRTSLVMRPDDQRGDATFKVRAGRRIARAGTVLAAFENEPTNANAMVPLFPDALHFLVGDVHSGAPVEPAPELIRTEDFTW